MSKGGFQGKPRQEEPWCALKESPNRKEALILDKCFQATWSWNEHAFNWWRCNQINHQCSSQTEINWEVVFCLSNTNFPNWMELFGIRGEYKKSGQRIKYIPIKYKFKNVLYIVLYQIGNILQIFFLFQCWTNTFGNKDFFTHSEPKSFMLLFKLVG